jgi:WD40 repeat protein
MSFPLSFASCSSTLSVWNISSFSSSDFSPSVRLSPHTGGISSFAYNHNQTVLISVGDDGQLALSFVSGGSLYSLHESFPLTCLSVTSGSRYVAVGGRSEKLNIWDLKKNSVAKSLNGITEALSCLELSQAVNSANSSLLASGSVVGNMKVHNLESGQLNCSFALPNTANSTSIVTCMNFSPHRLSSFVCSDSKGKVHLYDLNSSKHLFTFGRIHKAPAQGVKFHPIQSGLIISCSLDERIFIHDLNSKGERKLIDVGAPVTCIDIHQQGNLALCGTLSGQVKLFDLRKENQPLLEILNAHNGEVGVNCVKFALAESKKEGQTNASNGGINQNEDSSKPKPTNSFFSPLKADNHTKMNQAENGPINSNNPSITTPIRSSSIVKTFQESTKLSHQRAINDLLSTPLDQNNSRQTSRTAPSPSLSPSVTHSASLTSPVKVPPSQSAPLALPSSSLPPSSAKFDSNAVSSSEIQELRNYFSSEIDSLKESFHTELNNLHVEIVRQFHHSQQETASMMNQFLQEQRAILEEMRAIREEWREKIHIY